MDGQPLRHLVLNVNDKSDCRPPSNQTWGPSSSFEVDFYARLDALVYSTSLGGSLSTPVAREVLFQIVRVCWFWSKERRGYCIKYTVRLFVTNLKQRVGLFI